MVGLLRLVDFGVPSLFQVAPPSRELKRITVFELLSSTEAPSA